MGHCVICGKYFPNNISALDFLEHVNKEHKEKVKETVIEIKDHKWDNAINDKNNLEETKRIVEELQKRKNGLKNNSVKRLN
jgi:chromosome condensin MukBEF complex kleisin-like MukF subunit